MARPIEPPLFNWLANRGVGLLLHPTSLPSVFGVGSCDAAVDALFDYLVESGMSYWQTCPLGPTGYGDSPYQCFSSFAGNPYLIDPAALMRAGLLTEQTVAPLRALSPDRVDFGALYELKLPVLFAAFEAWRRTPERSLPYGDFSEFRSRNATWLESYAHFSALKDHYSGRPWWEWPEESRTFSAARASPLRHQLATRIEAHAFVQYLFFGQWRQVRERARKSGLQIVGDIPIFTALDSADVWASPHLFQLNRRTLRPLAVAGVPPDYFSSDGQLWGNPLYDWPEHAAENYAWWLARLRASFEFCDVVRIDHFRGFEAYWAVPAGSPTARNGRWMPGPGLEFFRAVRSALPEAKLIAEDLGLLTPATVALREATGLPGMAVLQFAFGGDSDNLYLPHNLGANCVVYPGTHDNDTTRGWYATAGEKVRDQVRRYFRIGGPEISWDFVRGAYASVANLAIIPLQDLLSLGSEARFNTPGKAQGNWTWRFRAEQLRGLSGGPAAYLRELAALYGRDAPVKSPAEKT